MLVNFNVTRKDNITGYCTAIPYIEYFINSLNCPIDIKLKLPNEVEVQIFRFNPFNVIAYAKKELICINAYHMNLLRSNEDVNKMFKTLAHEIIHIQQLHTKQLQLIPFTEEKLWKGKKYYGSSHTVYKRYRTQPWEQQANILAPHIVKKSFNHLLL